MNYKLISILTLLLLFGSEVKSQLDSNQTARNIVYIEAGGVGGYGSLNYELMIFQRSYLNLNARLGISTLNLRDFEVNFNPDIIIPFGLNALYGETHKLELGIGQVVSNTIIADPSTYEPIRETEIHANFTIGYRYQKNNGGFMYRINYSPIIESYESYRHWGGLSFGYSF